MEGYKILSIGDKLKNLRKKYGLKQEDLAGKDMTRNLISQIEHNKANLTRSSAEIMLKNLKEIYISKNITIDETVDYLIESEETQAKKILDKYIKELRDLIIYKDSAFENKLNEAEEFLANWDIRDEKIAIFELAGDYFCNINDFDKSYLYYEKAKAFIDINICNENVVSVLRKLSMVYFYIGKYEEDIKCCDFAIRTFKNLSEEYLYFCL